MGRVVVVNFISMDGVIQSPLSPDEDRDGGFDHGGWVPPYSDDTVNAFMQKATLEASGMLLGRRSYDIFFEAWAGADESEPAIAAMNSMPKFVVTSQPDDLRWQNSHRLTGAPAVAVEEVRDRVDGDLVVFGSGTLISDLARHDLIDEYRLLIFPLVLGAGKRMFDARGHFARFELSASSVSSSGVILATYTRARSS